MHDSQPVPGSPEDAWLTPARALSVNRRDLVGTALAGAVGAALFPTAGLSAAAATAQPGRPGFAFPTPCPEALSVKDFGAVGDGKANDTLAIQRAIDAAPSNGGTICFPPGDYRITRPLRIHDDDQADDPLAPGPPPGVPRRGRRGLRLVGSLTGAFGSVNCTIIWDRRDEPSTLDAPAMLQLFSRDCAVEHLAFHVGRGHVGAMIDVDKNPASGAVCTNNTFRNVQFRRAEIDNPGTFDYGVRIGETGPSGVDSMQFAKCFFLEAEQACVRIGGSLSGQSKHHTFLNCGFNGGSRRTLVGIDLRSGSFRTYSCAFGNIGRLDDALVNTTDAAIRLHAPADNLLIIDSDVENCVRFITTHEANTPGGWPVCILGGRFAVPDEMVVPDGEYIVFHYGGPLVILNSVFVLNVPLSSPSFKIRADAPGAGTVLISIGNAFSVHSPQSPYRNEPEFGNQRRISFGNKSVDVLLDSTTNIDDEIVNIGVDPGQGALSLGTVRAISATRTLARNLRGRVALPDGTMEAAVVFRDPFTNVPQPEPDADYFVTVLVSDAPLSPAPGSTHAYVTNKSPAGFTINLEAAPTAAVTVDWHLIR